MSHYYRAVMYFRQDLPLVVVWVFLIAASTLLGLLVAWPMAVLVDTVLAPAGAHVSNDWIHNLFLWPLPQSRVGQIVGLAVMGFALKIGQDLLGTAQAIVSNHINYNGLIRVRCDLYRKLQALNLGYHRAQPQGDAIYRLSSDTFGCQAILNAFVTAIVAVMTLIVMTGLLATRSPSLTLLAFSVAPFLVLANVVFGRRLEKRSLECKARDAQFTTTVQRSMSSIGLVQAFGREAEEFGRFHGTIRDAVRAWWSLNRQQMTYNLIVAFLFGAGGAAIFGYGGYLVYQDQFVNGAAAGGGGMTVGDLMVFTSYLGMLWGPLCTLTGFGANVQGGVASVRRVFEILDRDPIIADSPTALPLPRKPRVLELRDVAFGYTKDAAGDAPAETVQVLNGLSVRIQPGELVAFVGSSGVGKSTLLNLVPRFYDPTAGAVTFDGIDARDVRVKDLRRHVALVLQESVVLPTTIRENIAYGCPHASTAQIRAAAELAGAAEFIDRLPQGFETPVAEGGQNLSGGQRQRIAIARALLTEAPFIILDEPTSALDPQHERLITQTLRSLKRQRTIILVSHRLSTVVDCDRIYVMDGGRVVEQGTHEQLLARRGLYHSMAAHQLQLEPPPPRIVPRAA